LINVNVASKHAIKTEKNQQKQPLTSKYKKAHAHIGAINIFFSLSFVVKIAIFIAQKLGRQTTPTA